MNYGKVGRRRTGAAGRGLLRAGAGLYLGYLSLGAGQGVPLTPHQSSDQGVLEEPLVQTHPTLGQFVFPSRAGWCTQGGWGSVGTGLGVGWVLSLEGCEGGTAAPLGTWRG